VNRRAFLRLAAAGAAAIAGTLGVANRRGVLRVLTWSPIEDRIRARLPGLRLDRAGLGAFAADYQARVGRERRFGWWDPDIHVAFLASSDFFLHGARTDRVVRYVAYYDPYQNPCWNPCVRRP
jgi:hypothetical protein